MRLGLIITIALIIVISPFLIFMVKYDMTLSDTSRYPQGFGGHYQYELLIGSWNDVPVTNVTLLIPIPSWSFTQPKGNYSITDDVFTHRGTIAGNPPPSDYNFSVLQVQNRSFVKFTADSLKPRYEYILLYGTSVRGNITAPPVNTSDPIGHEILFYQTTEPYSLVPITQRRKFAYTLPLYADYKTHSDYVNIEISSFVEGKNRWLASHDNWDNNSYKDSFGLSLSEVPPGWTTVGAELESGMGIYPTPKPNKPT